VTAIEAAQRWIERGYWPLPVPFREKRPVEEGWQNLRITLEMVPKYFNGAQQNIGVLLGDRYNSADVDLDCHEAIRAAPEFLPETGLVFGRASKPASHWFYRSDPAVKTRKYFEKTRDGKQLLRKAMARFCPEKITEAEKQGFSAPDASWFKGESIDYVRRRLLNPKARIYDLIDFGTVQGLISDHLEGRENRRLLIWSLLNLEQLMEAYL